MQIEINIGKNLQGYFISQNGKTLLDSLSIGEVLDVIPHLEDSGFKLFVTGSDDDLSINISPNPSLEQIADADCPTIH